MKIYLKSNIKSFYRLCFSSYHGRNKQTQQVLLFTLFIMVIYLFYNMFTFWNNINSILFKSILHRKNNLIMAVDVKFYEKTYKNSMEVKISHGDMGEPVKLEENESKRAKDDFHLHEFNVVASDKIPLLRRLPEKRSQICFERKYPAELPKFDVVITFYNEAYSALMRTVHSVLSRSPPKYLNKIILIDDHSSDDFKDTVEKVRKDVNKLKKVKYIRLPENKGLIKARQIGAEYGESEVLIFLDSHCECFDGWSESLLSSLMQNPESIITPIIEIIDENNFEIRSTVLETTYVGSLTSKLTFRWLFDDKQNRSHFLKK